jgi:outer membrane protein OmpA-like peptidoglycan-associated protein
MSFPLKLLLAIVVWLVFYLLTFNGCHEELCHACDEAPQETTETDTGPAAVPDYPLYFKWSDTTAYTGSGIDSLKQAILDRGKEDQLLEITGFYFEDETPPEGYENMGLARAAEINRLFDGAVDPERVQMRARLVNEPDGARDQPFEAAAFDWNDAEVSETVDDIGDRILVRFPFGSVEKIYDEAVDEYLEKLANRVKETGERVELTGHTDFVGSDEDNIKLGQDRADAIKNILTQKGVPAEQISTTSKGESQPVASNESDEGRYENRRVEVRLIKQETETN